MAPVAFAKHEREATPPGLASTSSSAPEAKRQRNEPDAPTAAALEVYRHMLPNNPEAIAFLFGPRLSDGLDVAAERVATDYNINKAAAIKEFRRLIAIKIFTVDETATKISPTPLMDELWHAAILDTQLYADLQRALGVTVHHRPSGASQEESEQRAKRLAAMTGLYRGFFSAEPLRRVSPRPRTHQPEPLLSESEPDDDQV